MRRIGGEQRTREVTEENDEDKRREVLKRRDG
jgi:hypothetical protein